MANRHDYRFALNIAHAAHRGQVDKAGAPYVQHPIRVAKSVRGWDKKIVALLHDVIEDTSGPAQEFYKTLILITFSSEISYAIDCITHKKNESRVEYYERVKRSPLAIEVKLADIADNLDPKRFSLLDTDTQTRLNKKYTLALEVLNG